MRKVGSLENLEKADTFRWYLMSQNIETKMEDSGETPSEIWIFRDEDWKKARALFEDFQNASDLSAFSSAADHLRKSQSVHSAPETGVPLSQSIASQPLATFALIAASSIFFLMHFLDRDRWLMRQMMISQDLLANSLGVKSFREIMSGQVWRLFTPVFIHTDFFHIAFNMMWLYQFGRLSEEAVGTFRFILIVLFIAIPSNLAFYLVSGPLFGGMSGVVYGLFFFMWAYDHFSYNSPFRIDPNLAKFFVGFYVLCWVLSALGFRVANTVHGVGALCGFLAGVLISGHWKRIRKRFRINAMVVYNSLIVLALLAGGILTDILTR